MSKESKRMKKVIRQKLQGMWKHPEALKEFNSQAYAEELIKKGVSPREAVSAAIEEKRFREEQKAAFEVAAENVEGYLRDGMLLEDALSSAVEYALI